MVPQEENAWGELVRTVISVGSPGSTRAPVGSSVNCLPHDVHLCPKEGFTGTWCEHRGPQLTYEAAV